MKRTWSDVELGADDQGELMCLKAHPKKRMDPFVTWQRLHHLQNLCYMLGSHYATMVTKPALI